MPGSPFFFGDDGGDQMANSGTWLDLLRQKLPAAFDATAAPPPMNANGAAPSYGASAPVIPPSSAGDPGAAPDASATPNYQLPWMRQFQQQQAQPQQPPMTTPTGQMVPGLNKAQKLEVLLTSGLKGAMAGRAASENAVVQSGGRRSGGAGIGFEAGFEQPLIDASRQQQFQRSQLENQQLQQQVQFYPQTAALGIGKTISDIQKNTAEAGKATAEGGKATAEAGAIPTKTALEQAQALAARYKEDPGSGSLIDLQTGQPINATRFRSAVGGGSDRFSASRKATAFR